MVYSLSYENEKYTYQFLLSVFFQGETKRSVKNLIGEQLFNRIEKGVDKSLGETMRREHMEQRDKVVIDIHPDERGFKQVLAGQCFRSEKLKQKMSSQKLLYLTILTRQFLIQVIWKFETK